MRIKYDKGMTPERIASHFVQFIRDNNLIIGSVNIYIQTYDDEMRAAKISRDDDYIIVQPREVTKSEYIYDVAQIRRGRMRLVKCREEGGECEHSEQVAEVSEA